MRFIVRPNQRLICALMSPTVRLLFRGKKRKKNPGERDRLFWLLRETSIIAMRCAPHLSMSLSRTSSANSFTKKFHEKLLFLPRAATTVRSVTVRVKDKRRQPPK